MSFYFLLNLSWNICNFKMKYDQWKGNVPLVQNYKLYWINFWLLHNESHNDTSQTACYTLYFQVVCLFIVVLLSKSFVPWWSNVISSTKSGSWDVCYSPESTSICRYGHSVLLLLRYYVTDKRWGIVVWICFYFTLN